MKIGIYTFFRINYGACLQAFSLQRTLKELRPNDEVLMVDYMSRSLEAKTKPFHRKSPNRLYDLVWRFCTLLRYRQIKQRYDAFRQFPNKYFNLTRRYFTFEELVADPPQLDIHLSGSDQVFNPKRRLRDIYFLNFDVNGGRKVAYAPSFGVSKFTEEEKAYIARCAKDFDTLNCRESDGAALLSELTGRNVPVVLDPVFLTPAETWRTIEVEPARKERYVFIYCLKGMDRLLNLAKQLPAPYNGYKLVALTANDLRFYRGCKQVFDAGPAELVGLIDHAELVLTDSFHGTAFSVLLQKNFYTYISRPEVSSRITSLLARLALEDHIITGKNILPKDIVQHDYQAELKLLTAESLNYLTQAIEG